MEKLKMKKIIYRYKTGNFSDKNREIYAEQEQKLPLYYFNKCNGYGGWCLLVAPPTYCITLIEVVQQKKKKK